MITADLTVAFHQLTPTSDPSSNTLPFDCRKKKHRMGFAVNAFVANSNAVSGWVSLCTKAAPLTSIVLVMAPIPTIQRVVQERTVGSLPLLPYSSMIGNAFVWVMYGEELFSDVYLMIIHYTIDLIWTLYRTSQKRPESMGAQRSRFYSWHILFLAIQKVFQQVPTLFIRYN
jgi:hypothetical protein